jgi:hypothetical protein
MITISIDSSPEFVKMLEEQGRGYALAFLADVLCTEFVEKMAQAFVDTIIATPDCEGIQMEVIPSAALPEELRKELLDILVAEIGKPEGTTTH